MRLDEASLGENGLEDFEPDTRFDSPLEFDLSEYFESWIDPAKFGNRSIESFSGAHHVMEMYAMYLSGTISLGRNGSDQFKRCHSVIGLAINKLNTIDDILMTWFVNTLYIEKKDDGMTKQQISNVIEKTFEGELEEKLRDALRREAYDFYEQ